MDKGHDPQNHHLGNGQVAVRKPFVFQSGEFGPEAWEFIDHHIRNETHQRQSDKGQDGSLEKTEKKPTCDAHRNHRQEQ